jgi:hypothetical protein
MSDLRDYFKHALRMFRTNPGFIRPPAASTPPKNIQAHARKAYQVNLLEDAFPGDPFNYPPGWSAPPAIQPQLV